MKKIIQIVNFAPRILRNFGLLSFLLPTFPHSTPFCPFPRPAGHVRNLWYTTAQGKTSAGSAVFHFPKNAYFASAHPKAEDRPVSRPSLLDLKFDFESELY